MNQELRWKQRFQNFDNAFNTFLRTLQRAQKHSHDEVILMALVQTFEFTYELSWNTMKDFLENEGFSEIKTPRQVMRTAFQAGLILDAESWLNMIQKRNLVSHTYNALILQETVNYIISDFFPLVQSLHHSLKEKI